jgi:hypothetical protein
MKLIFSLILAAATLLSQTTINGGRTITGPFDASGAATTKPHKSGTTAPGTCSVGETFFDTDATAGSNLYGCTATNVWTLQGGGGSYTLPTATGSVLGGIKIGSGLSIDGGGVVTASGGSSAATATAFEVVEEFLQGASAAGQVGALGWFTSVGAAATVTNNTEPVVGVPGYVRGEAHGTNADSYVSITMGNSDAATITSPDWAWQARIKLGSTSNSRTWIGMGASAAVVPARFLGFRYDTASAYSDDTKGTTGRWVAQMCVSSGCTDTGGTYVVTSVQPDTNFHLYEITKSGSTYTFKIDGTQRATFCASGCNTTVTAMVGYANLGFLQLGFETGAGYLYSHVDRFYLSMSGLSR